MKKKSAKEKTCKCVENVNIELAKIGSNTRVSMNHIINFNTGKTRSTVMLATEKEDTKKREALKPIIPTYCPFCGKKYN